MHCGVGVVGMEYEESIGLRVGWRGCGMYGKLGLM